MSIPCYPFNNDPHDFLLNPYGHFPTSGYHGGMMHPGYGSVHDGGIIVQPTPEQEAELAALQQQQHNARMQAQAFSPPPRIRPNFMVTDKRQPDTLGWREWEWSPTEKCLVSPQMGTRWTSATLKAPIWDREDVVRGTSGIHALLVPKHWKIIGEFNQKPYGHGFITGIVERFGRFVLGTEGWRAEKVVIRELLAPSLEIGLALEQRYPDVIVHYPDQLEEEGATPCTSETSSGSASAIGSLIPLTGKSSPSVQSQFTIRGPIQLPPPGVSGRRSPRDLAEHWRWLKTMWSIVGIGWAIIAAAHLWRAFS